MRSLDLFCGAGGLTAGLHAAGWTTTYAIDLDSAACETFATNFPEVKVMRADAATYDFSSLAGQVELVAGGPPCQPFSVAGKQLAWADPRDCVPHFIRAVREVRPRAFLMENVAGLAAGRHTSYLANVRGSLENLGYVVRQWVVDAADFGVPQHRLRLVMVGICNELPILPHPTHGPRGAKAYRCAGDAIADAPYDLPNVARVTYAKNPVLRPQPWDGMLVNGGGRPINLSEPSQTIPASAGGNRTHIVDPDGVLVAYHAHVRSGGQPRSGIVEGVRRLNVRESARLQSFDDTFAFIGTQSARYRLVGNAVPPGLARHLGMQLLMQLHGLNVEDGTAAAEPSQLLLV